MFSNADQNFLISFPPTTTFVLASEGERTSRVYARVQVLRTRAHLRMLANFVGIFNCQKEKTNGVSILLESKTKLIGQKR